MKRILSVLLAVIMVFALALPVMAAETTGETTDETSSVAETVIDETTTEETATVSATFSGEKTKVKIPGSNTSFSMPSELKVVTFASNASELSDVGITRTAFTANGYVFFAYSEDETNPVYFQMIRTKDDYSAYIKDYKRLSKAERQAMVDDALGVVETNSYTYTTAPSYSDAEFVKYAGMYCLKTVAYDGSAVEYTSVKNGYTYVITCSYYDTMADSDLKAVEDMINSLKVSNPVDVQSVLLYAALAVIVLLIAAFVVLYLKFTEVNVLLRSIFEDCDCGCEGDCDCDDDCDCCDCEDLEALDGADPNSFDDSDFAEPYAITDAGDDESEEAAEEETSEE